MRKKLAIGSAILLLAVGAADKRAPRLALDRSVFDDAPVVLAGAGKRPEPQLAYRACTGPRDDRCIQTNERSVRLALRAAAPAPAARAASAEAVGGPVEERTNYPLCSRLITDECIDSIDRRRPPREGARTPGI